MKICPVCGKELDDAVKFCVKCGADLRVAPAESANADVAPAKEVVAPAESANANVASAEEVVAPAEEVTETVPAEEIVAPAEEVAETASVEAAEPVYEDISSGKEIADEPVSAPKAPKSPPKKKKGKKGLFIGLGVGIGAVIMGAVALILAVAILLGAIFIFAPKAPAEYLLYFKDGELYYSDFEGDPFVVTQRLLDGVDDADEFLFEHGYEIGRFIQISSDRSKLFFIDRVDPEDDAATIYYRDLKKPENPAEKLDSGITDFVINEKGDRVLYCKDGDLYSHDLTERTKLASEITRFATDAKCEKIIYTDDNGGLYGIKGDEERKLDSGVTYIECTQSLDTIYYTKEDGLFKNTDFSKKEKICSGEVFISAIYDSGEVYYYDVVTEEKPLIDFVDDDMALDDSGMIEPTEPDLDYYFDIYYDFWDAYDAYIEAYEKYNEALDRYEDKLYRDSLRELLSQETYAIDVRTLYYYDGKKAEKVAENFGWASETYEEEAVMVFKTYNAGEVGKIKFSEIDNQYDVRTFVSEGMEKKTNTYVAFKNNTIQFSDDDSNLFRISDDGKTLWYLSKMDEDTNTSDLYRAELSGGKVGKATLYDTDVSNQYGIGLLGDKCIYFKDCDSWIGTFYIDKQEIDYDVYTFSLQYDEEKETFYYLTDGDSDDYCGTLKTYNGEKKKLADDVSDFELTSEGKLVYLSSYDLDYYSGELWVYDGKKAEMIDDVVTGFAREYENFPGMIHTVVYEEYY